MTTEQINEACAGLAGENVERFRDTFYVNPGDSGERVWSPVTDLNQAYEVILPSGHHCTSYGTYVEAYDGWPNVRVSSFDVTGNVWFESPDEIALALCTSALKAAGKWEE